MGQGPPHRVPVVADDASRVERGKAAFTLDQVPRLVSQHTPGQISLDVATPWPIHALAASQAPFGTRQDSEHG
eukprot:1317965-Rhodomonas_salina.1